MANQKIQEVLGLMQKNLECAICLELLKNPVATNCHHHFCRFCITEFLTAKRYAPCPLCKQPVSKRSLQEKEELSNIVSGIRSLIAAFQEDSGSSFSPPKGPQSFFPCTPEPISQKSKFKKAKVKKSRPGRPLETAEREGGFYLPEADKDTSDGAGVSTSILGLQPEKYEVIQGLNNAMVTAGLEGGKLESRTHSSTLTSSPKADDILDYLNQGACNPTGSGCNFQDENTDDNIHSSFQSNQTIVKGSKRRRTEDKSLHVFVETRNVSNVSLRGRVVRSLPMVEKENLDSVTTRSVRKGRQDIPKPGLVDSSNSVAANDCSQNSSDQSISSTQQFLQPRPLPTRTYSRHGSRPSASFKVKNWIASLPSTPHEVEKTNDDEVVLGLEIKTSIENNIEDNAANSKGASSAEVHRRPCGRTRSSSVRKNTRKDSDKVVEGTSHEAGSSPLASKKDLEYCFGFMCEDSVISNHDEVIESALPQEPEKSTSSSLNAHIPMGTVAPLNANNTEVLPESSVHDQLILVTPARTRSIFKKQESLGQLTPEPPSPSTDPYLFVVGQTPVPKPRRGRPRSKENKSSTKSVTGMRRGQKKSIKLPDASANSETAENKMVKRHEETLDSTSNKNVESFSTESLCSSNEREEACEISVERPSSVSPLSLPMMEEADLNKTSRRTSRQRVRKAAEKKVQTSGEERKDIEDQAEKLASWIDQAEEHDLLFSTQDAHASLESSEHNADDENVEDEIGGDNHAVAEHSEEVDAVCLIEASDQQLEDNLSNDADLVGQIGDVSVTTPNQQSRASKKTRREDTPCEMGTNKRNITLTRTPVSCDVSDAAPKKQSSMFITKGAQDVPCEPGTYESNASVSPCKSKQQFPADLGKAVLCEPCDIVPSTQQSCQNSLCNVHPSPVAALLPPKFSTPRQLTAKQSRCIALTQSSSDTGISGAQMSSKSERSTIPSKKRRFDVRLAEKGGTQPVLRSPITRSTRSRSLKQARLLTEEAACIPVHEEDVTVSLDQRPSGVNHSKEGSAGHSMETEQPEDTERQRSCVGLLENKLKMSLNITGTTFNKRDLSSDAIKSQDQKRGSTEGCSVTDNSLVHHPALVSVTDTQGLTDAKKSMDKNMGKGRLGRQSKDRNDVGDEISEQESNDTISETTPENSMDSKLEEESAYRQSLLEVDNAIDTSTVPGNKETLAGCNCEHRANNIQYKDIDTTELTQDSSVTYIPGSADIEECPSTDTANNIFVVAEKRLNPEQKCYLHVPSTDLQDQMFKSGLKEIESAILQPPLQKDMNFSSSETLTPSQSLLQPARMLSKAGGTDLSPTIITENTAERQIGFVSTNPEENVDKAQNTTNCRVHVDYSACSMEAASCDDSQIEPPSTSPVEADASVKESVSNHLPVSSNTKECNGWPDENITAEQKEMRSKICTKDELHDSTLEGVSLEDPSCSLSTVLQAADMGEMSLALPASSRKRKLSEVDNLGQAEGQRHDCPLVQTAVAKCVESPVYCHSEETIHSAPSQMTKITLDTDDEDTAVIVRRPTKRKCFSLEGSPLASRTPLATRRYKSRHARRALSKAFLLHDDADKTSTRKSDMEDYVSEKEGDEKIVKAADTSPCTGDMKHGEELLADSTNTSLKLSSMSPNCPLASVAYKPAECTSPLSREVLSTSNRAYCLTSKESTTSGSVKDTVNRGAEKDVPTPGSASKKPESRRRTKRGLATFENVNIITSVVQQFKSPTALRTGTNRDGSPGNSLVWESNNLVKETAPSNMDAAATETVLAAKSKQAADSEELDSLKINFDQNTDHLQVLNPVKITCLKETLEDATSEICCDFALRTSAVDDFTAGTRHNRQTGENTETFTKQDIHELQTSVLQDIHEQQNSVAQDIHELENPTSVEQVSLITIGDDATLPPSGIDLGISNMDGNIPDLNDKCANVESAPISSDSFIPGDCRQGEGRKHLDHQQTLTDKSLTENVISLERKRPVTPNSNEESDEEEELMPVKNRRHPPIILESDSQSSDAAYSDEDDDVPSCQLSSSAVSSQSEILTTQQQQALEADLEQLRQNIAREEARLLQLQCDGKEDKKDTREEEQASRRSLRSNVSKQAVPTLQNMVHELRESEDEEDEHGETYSARKTVQAPGSHALVREQNHEIVDVNDDDSNELFPSPLSPSPPPVVKASLARKDTSLLTRSIFDMDVSEVRSLTKITKLRQVLEFTSHKASDVAAEKVEKDTNANDQDSPDSDILVSKKTPKIIPESQPSTGAEAKDLQSQHLSPSPQEVLAKLQGEQTREFLARSPSPPEMSQLHTDVHHMDIEKDLDDMNSCESDCPVTSPEVTERDDDSDSECDFLCDHDKEKKEEQNVIYHHGVDINFDEEPRWQWKKMGFAASGLTAEKLGMLRKLAENYECKVYSKFNDHVTHVIMRAQDDPAVRVCERTLKYFQGVAGRCWVLNFAWVQDSLNQGHLVPEADYEIEGDTVKGENHNGPRKSRLAVKPLLEGFAFACVGASPDMSKKEVRQLLQLSGAEVVEDPWYLAAHPAKLKLVLRCVDSEAQPVMAAETELFNGQYKHSRLVTVKREWLLDSIGTQTLQPLLFYVCNTCKNLRLPF